MCTTERSSPHGLRSRERILSLGQLSPLTLEPPEAVDSLAAIRQWHAKLLELPPLHFVELAAHLRDRP